MEHFERQTDPEWQPSPSMGVPNSVQDYEKIFNQFLRNEAAINKYTYSRLHRDEGWKPASLPKRAKKTSPVKKQEAADDGKYSSYSPGFRARPRLASRDMSADGRKGLSV